jgi:glycosyltransferase AglD
MSEPSVSTRPASSGDIVGSFFLSYLVAGLLLVALARLGDIWYILANSRLLNLMIGAGLIRYHDRQWGLIDGIPEVKLFMQANDPINWTVLALAFSMFLLFWGAKALQFHAIARHCGVAGGLGEHARAYLYGSGLGQVMPFRLGALATAEASSPGRAGAPEARAMQLVRSATAFEIVVFAGIGLLLVGWRLWLLQIGSAVLLAVAASLFLFGAVRAPLREFLDGAREAIAPLRARPLALVQIAVLSLVAFTLIDEASYYLAQAFTTVQVLLGVDMSIMLMALVCGYIARWVPLTPGGIGMFEWGMALALFLGGSSFPQSVTVALLVSVFRIAAVLFLALGARLFFPTGTNLELLRERLHTRVAGA